jgi:hypothetical protein
MSISKIIPNPLDKDSNLSELEKKGGLIKEGFGLISIIKNIIFLSILGFVLVGSFKVSPSIVAFLIGAEILVKIIAGYIKIKKIRSVYGIKTQDNARSYRKILVTGEYYDLLGAFFGVIANSLSVALIFLFFSNELSDFVIQNIPVKADLSKYLVLLPVFFSASEFVVRSVRYYLIKNIKESDDLAQVNQEYVLIEKKLELIKFIPGMSLFLLILFLTGIPVFIPLLFTGFMLLMVLLSIIEIKRIKNIRFDNNEVDASVARHNIENYPDEQISGSVFGVMKTGVGLFGGSFLGSGKTYYPENALLITNYRLLFIQIPITGGDKIAGKTDYVSQNVFFNRSELRQKGEQILKTNSLARILNHASNDVLYKDIRTVTLKHTQIIIEKFAGEKISYVFMDREYIESLKQLFKFHLNERFIEE